MKKCKGNELKIQSEDRKMRTFWKVTEISQQDRKCLHIEPYQTRTFNILSLMHWHIILKCGKGISGKLY